MIGGHYVVNRDRHDGLQVSCNSVHTIYKVVNMSCSLYSLHKSVHIHMYIYFSNIILLLMDQLEYYVCEISNLCS